MYNYLELRKEELKKRGNKGFTLMEMLIVVAIIAVLIAIAIPVFTSQLENSRESTDAANIRGAYAEVTAASLTGAKTSSTGLPAGVDYTSSSKWQKTVNLEQQQQSWQNPQLKDGKIGSITLGTNDSQPSPSGKCAVAVDSQGNLTLTFSAS